MKDTDDELAENACGDIDVEAQIFELNRKHWRAMVAISALSQEPQRSYVLVPRERQITPFSGEYDKDGCSVNDFIEEVERVLYARN